MEKWIKWISIFIISTISGILGRLGGSASGNRLFRLLGVSGACMAITVIMYHPLNWWYYGAVLLSFGAILGTTSTYYKAKNSDAVWWNWIIYGAMEGIAFLPVTIVTGHWWGLLIRTVVCSGLLTAWDTIIGIDWLEEFGRYFIVAITVPLAFI